MLPEAPVGNYSSSWMWIWCRHEWSLAVASASRWHNCNHELHHAFQHSGSSLGWAGAATKAWLALALVVSRESITKENCEELQGCLFQVHEREFPGVLGSCKA